MPYESLGLWTQNGGNNMTNKLFSVIGFLIFAGPAWGQAAPDGSSVFIDRIDYGGSGCPADSVAYNLSDDALAFTMIFDAFDLDNGTRGGRNKKHCNINLKLAVPSGWSYTLFSVDYRGYADLPKNTDARLRAWYSIGSSEQIRISNLKIKGEFLNDYERRAGVPLDALPWQGCNDSDSTIHINTELMVNGRNAFMTVDTVDGEMSQTYGIAWRPCSNSSNWVSNCRVEMETVWGTNMQTFRAVGYGASHTDAKEEAQRDAHAQCEEARSQFRRPLLRALTECRTHAYECTAVPE
jgi:hypothetical protein